MTNTTGKNKTLTKTVLKLKTEGRPQVVAADF